MSQGKVYKQISGAPLRECQLLGQDLWGAQETFGVQREPVQGTFQIRPGGWHSVHSIRYGYGKVIPDLSIHFVFLLDTNVQHLRVHHADCMRFDSSYVALSLYRNILCCKKCYNTNSKLRDSEREPTLFNGDTHLGK